MRKTLDDIKQILANRIDANLKIEQIEDEISLLEDGLGLDSIAIVNFLVNLETHFDIEFDESEMQLDLFKNIKTLANAVDKKILNTTD